MPTTSPPKTAHVESVKNHVPSTVPSRNRFIFYDKTIPTVRPIRINLQARKNKSSDHVVLRPTFDQQIAVKIAQSPKVLIHENKATEMTEKMLTSMKICKIHLQIAKTALLKSYETNQNDEIRNIINSANQLIDPSKIIIENAVTLESINDKLDRVLAQSNLTKPNVKAGHHVLNGQQMTNQAKINVNSTSTSTSLSLANQKQSKQPSTYAAVIKQDNSSFNSTPWTEMKSSKSSKQSIKKTDFKSKRLIITPVMQTNDFDPRANRDEINKTLRTAGAGTLMITTMIK